ncbi:MAG: hypothetical protein JWO54_697 [Candidatus Saccharibacteria bacterium]|nr:hypothetical protein [Candidatus Saccharibacteria bacterium]
MIIDSTLFDMPVSREERAVFKQQFSPKHTPFGLNYFSWFIFLGVALLLILWGISTYNYDSSVTQHRAGVTMIAFGFVPMIALSFTVLTFRKKINRSVKIYRFAKANGLNYDFKIKNPIRNGLIFSNPGTKESFIYDGISRMGERPFEIGNYYFETGSSYSRASRSHLYGFMRITLDKQLPHMVLDATSDDIKFAVIRISQLGASFAKDQVLKLEGDFNDHFTLYAPKEYETDALYVFTPDLMAHFIDTASTYNAEIIDNNLYIYSLRPFFLDKPETYQRLFAILETVGLKALKQTSNYRDSRSDVAGTVASGRRLKRGISATVILTIVIIIVANVFENFDAIQLLFR